MATQIKNIINKYHGSDKWHVQYPWFPTGHLIQASIRKNSPGFTETARHAVIFFNDVHRFHWLLYEEVIDRDAILAEFETATDDPIADEATGLPYVSDGESTEPAEPSAVQKRSRFGTDLPEALVGVTETVTSGSGENAALPVTTQVQPEEPVQIQDYDPDDTDAAESVESEAKLGTVAQVEETALQNSSLSHTLAEASKNFKEDAPADAKLVIESEPYHTVDYFASQGIRLELEPKADDKFGQQLKSFTSWLKQMKRLPSVKIAEKEPDAEVEDIAIHSLDGAEVVTESMAEVLLKQGKRDQAIGVWKKLSLLHPEKSHYFASLIEKTTL